MTSSALLCLLSPPTLSLRNPSLSFSSCLHLPQLFSSGIGFAGKVRNQYQLGLPSARCNAIPKARVMQVQGMAFIKENMGKLEDEIAEYMPIGFEITFPSLVGIARSLGLELSFDSPVLEDIHAKRNLKVSRIPKEMMHKMPTTLLYSLEGLPDLDWEKLLKLQNQNGSFLFSPSSTAFALMETKDQKCLDYIGRVVERFKGGVPGSFPIDMFEHIWAVDRLERLGISRYFELEIKTCLDYVFRYWSEDGIAWARNSRVVDVDDTAMGFRILRLHGYQVSADVLAHFEKGGEYFCFVGQSNQAVTGIFNLYRASQVMLPGEKILEDAKRFSYKFLSEKQASGQLLDKWIITKDLPGEDALCEQQPLSGFGKTRLQQLPGVASIGVAADAKMVLRVQPRGVRPEQNQRPAGLLFSSGEYLRAREGHRASRVGPNRRAPGGALLLSRERPLHHRLQTRLSQRFRPPRRVGFEEDRKWTGGGLAPKSAPPIMGGAPRPRERRALPPESSLGGMAPGAVAGGGGVGRSGVAGAHNKPVRREVGPGGSAVASQLQAPHLHHQQSLPPAPLLAGDSEPQIL